MAVALQMSDLSFYFSHSCSSSLQKDEMTGLDEMIGINNQSKDMDERVSLCYSPSVV